MTREHVDQVVMGWMARQATHATGDPLTDEFIDDIIISSGAMAKAALHSRDAVPELNDLFLGVLNAWKEVCCLALDRMTMPRDT